MARTRTTIARLKELAAAALLTLVAFHAPWRLMRLAADVMVLRPGQTRMSQGDSRYWDALRLQTRLEWLGYQVFYERNLNVMGRPAFGLTDRSEHIIRIDADLHWDARYMVLAHEGGHVLQPGWLGQYEGDIFAENVATLLTDGSVREHARYLSDAKALYLTTTIAEWRAIYHAAAVLQD